MREREKGEEGGRWMRKGGVSEEQYLMKKFATG